MVLQEQEIKTGQNGQNLKFNLIQSTFVSKVTQFVSCQDALHQFATTDTQVWDIHAIRRLKLVHPKEDQMKNGQDKIQKVWLKMLSNIILNHKMRMKLKELLTTLLDIRNLKTSLGSKLDFICFIFFYLLYLF